MAVPPASTPKTLRLSRDTPIVRSQLEDFGRDNRRIARRRFVAGVLAASPASLSKKEEAACSIKQDARVASAAR
jgi:hypothetical protein